MNRSRPTTLEDVARVAGVSRATVSFALTGTGRLSDETRERVRRIAAELDYAVNIGARNLRRAKAGAIGIYLPESTNGLAYYMNFLFGVVEVAAASSLSVTIVPGGRARDAGRAHVDGFILIDPPDDDDSVRSILASRMPVVSGEITPAGADRPWGTVYSDHASGMRAILDHLLERGARRPALLAPPTTTAWAREVRASYLAWCAEQAIQPLVEDSTRRATPDDVRRITTGLLSASATPDAIISAPDGSAVGAVSAVRALGLSVGDDVLVTAYADSLAMEMCDPPVTAIDLHARDFGVRCAALLLQALGDPGPAAEEVQEAFTIDLRARASTLGRGAAPATV